MIPSTTKDLFQHAHTRTLGDLFFSHRILLNTHANSLRYSSVFHYSSRKLGHSEGGPSCRIQLPFHFVRHATYIINRKQSCASTIQIQTTSLYRVQSSETRGVFSRMPNDGVWARSLENVYRCYRVILMSMGRS
jgi:hypothetical protein